MDGKEYFERVYRIRTKLYKIAFPYFNSESMAIDMVDEACFKGYIKRRQLKDEAYLETWLVRILINLCRTKYKKMKLEVDISEFDELTSASEYENLSLHEAIKKLPEELRRIVVLKYFGGYKIVEIAEILEIPQGTAATRLRKALKLLKLDLGEE